MNARCCWTGGRKDFNGWRNWIGSLAGYDVGHWQAGTMPSPKLDWDSIPEGYAEGEWGDDKPDDVLVVLLCHHECEGRIPHEFCQELADRVEDLLENVKGFPMRDKSREIVKTCAFIVGLRRAADTLEDAVFQ